MNIGQDEDGMLNADLSQSTTDTGWVAWPVELSNIYTESHNGDFYLRVLLNILDKTH